MMGKEDSRTLKRHAMQVMIRDLTPGFAVPELPTEGEVHVWVADLDRADAQHPKLLTAEEHARAARYRMVRIREQFITGRALLRLLLSRYLGLEPIRVPIEYEPNGKPLLAAVPSCVGWHFNLSHSEGTAIYAITRGARVGVDIEKRRAIASMDNLVQRFFSPNEREVFAGLAGTERESAFFHAWTRKEALLKARGESVQFFERFEVSLDPADARLIAWEGEPATPSRWSLWSGELGEYVAAVALESQVR